jgi:uncharacterized protein (DUF58 family)
MFRRFQVFALCAILVVAAFSTGLAYLFYLVYLVMLVVGGSYVLTRLGLADLEAGYAVNQLNGHVGEQLRVTYTVRHTGRIPKPWLEVHNPTNLPSGLPGRAISLGSRAERSWLVRLPLTRRGHFRIEPLLIRTGDPFGFFEASASVGHGVSVVVYPRIERLPLWRLPAANIEGSHAMPERTLQTTPLATTVRPWAPGDSFNRIHWKSTARHGEIQVKEFDLEQTADVWIFLDLEGAVQAGVGEESTVEVAVRAAASIADRSIVENRAVGMTVNSHRTTVLPADRGGRQHMKVMQLLAAVEADGTTPLAETLVSTLSRLRRGMTAVVITSSQERDWVRPLATLRGRGVGCVVVSLDPHSYAVRAQHRAGVAAAGTDDPSAEAAAQRARALHHALAEYELPTYRVTAGRPLAEVLAG